MQRDYSGEFLEIQVPIVQQDSISYTTEIQILVVQHDCMSEFSNGSKMTSITEYFGFFKVNFRKTEAFCQKILKMRIFGELLHQNLRG